MPRSRENRWAAAAAFIRIPRAAIIRAPPPPTGFRARSVASVSADRPLSTRAAAARGVRRATTISAERGGTRAARLLPVFAAVTTSGLFFYPPRRLLPARTACLREASAADTRVRFYYSPRLRSRFSSPSDSRLIVTTYRAPQVRSELPSPPSNRRFRRNIVFVPSV